MVRWVRFWVLDAGPTGRPRCASPINRDCAQDFRFVATAMDPRRGETSLGDAGRGRRHGVAPTGAGSRLGFVLFGGDLRHRAWG